MDWLGKWSNEIHETLGNFMHLGVSGHVGAVILISMGKTDSQLRSMITWCVACNGPDLVTHNLIAVALVMLLVVSFWSGQTHQYILILNSPISLNDYIFLGSMSKVMTTEY